MRCPALYIEVHMPHSNAMLLEMESLQVKLQGAVWYAAICCLACSGLELPGLAQAQGPAKLSTVS